MNHGNRFVFEPTVEINIESVKVDMRPLLRYDNLDHLFEKCDIEQSQALCSIISKDARLSNDWFDGPVGRRRMIHCDYAASGKPLKKIERFMSTRFYSTFDMDLNGPSYASKTTRSYVKQAVDLIRKECKCSPDDYLFFVGSGSTSAVNTLLSLMNIKCERPQKLTVVVSSFEHHSNLLPWNEMEANIKKVKARDDGKIDIDDLASVLERLQNKGRDIICSFRDARFLSTQNRL
ncbi:hypothetical protein ACOME3_002481 [Neoechinorhynchus agilis]